ncbi:WRKY transcription factor 22 [Silene latifolia]|uniref:WRKY transcription factor 22 n=1 Tax=Silene latifolia TaxID=37657 RepID=UPI003D7713C4
MDGPHDWDLLAIVRSCSSTTASTTVSSPPPPPPQPQQPPPFTYSPTSTLFGFSNPVTTTTSFSTGYQEICSTSTPAFTVSRVVKPLSNTGSHSQSQRIKKRKKLMKKVCHVPSEGLSSDKWAWRKYGQKPIKGSPYPRGYYKCSSSKGCLARKQVERNKSDPKMFIITYTSDHNHPFPTHRSTLAGSTRQKTLTPTSTPPASPSATSVSPLTERSESNTDDKQGLSDLMLNDDFYAGFDQIDDVIDDTDCFSEFFSTSSEFPWLANGCTTTTTASTVASAGGVV